MLLAAECLLISSSLSVGADPTPPSSKQVKGERSESGNGLSEAREYKERPFTAQSVRKCARKRKEGNLTLLNPCKAFIYAVFEAF